MSIFIWYGMCLGAFDNLTFYETDPAENLEAEDLLFDSQPPRGAAIGSKEFEHYVWKTFGNPALSGQDYYELDGTNFFLLEEILRRFDLPIVLRNCADKLEGIKLSFPGPRAKLSTIIDTCLPDNTTFNVNRFDKAKGVSLIYFDITWPF